MFKETCPVVPGGLTVRGSVVFRPAAQSPTPVSPALVSAQGALTALELLCQPRSLLPSSGSSQPQCADAAAQDAPGSGAN